MVWTKKTLRCGQALPKLVMQHMVPTLRSFKSNPETRRRATKLMRAAELMPHCLGAESLKKGICTGRHLERNFAKASEMRPDFGHKPQQASAEQDDKTKLRTLAVPPSCRPTESCDDSAALGLHKFSWDLFNRGGDEVSPSLLMQSWRIIGGRTVEASNQLLCDAVWSGPHGRRHCCRHFRARRCCCRHRQLGRKEMASLGFQPTTDTMVVGMMLTQS
jgi:hypothetical protein